MRYEFFGTACVLLLLSGCGSGPKAAASKNPEVEGQEKTVEKDGISLTARLTPKQPRLSDTITFDLTVRSDPEVEIKPPTFGKGVKEFTIRDYVKMEEKFEEGKRVRRFRYKLEAEQAGKLLIRSQQVEYIDKRSPPKEPGKRTFIASAPIEINVTTEASEKPDLNDLAQMAEPVPLEAGWSKWVWRLAIGGGVLGLIGLALLIMHLRKKQLSAPQVVLTPEQIARAELDALLNEKLAERGEFQEFYVRLTGIVRRYIERKTGIHAPEQTTEEFLHDPTTRTAFSYEHAERLGSFLEAADMVKYAAVKPGERELAESVDRAREFIGMQSALAPMPEMPNEGTVALTPRASTPVGPLPKGEGKMQR